MEKSMIVLAIIVSTLLVIIWLIIWLTSFTKTKRQTNKFQRKGEQYKLCFSEMDTWGYYGIGIDRKSKCLLYAKGKEFNDLTEPLDLQKIRRGETNIVSRKVGKMDVIDKVELRIILKEASANNIVLEFFDVRNGSQIDGECQIAEKWKTIINESIS
jgi:hypothetical protein